MEIKMNKYPTDVDGVFADDIETYGVDEFPVFDVEYNTFASIKGDRNKISAPEDTSIYQYTRSSQINRPFYARTEFNGEKIMKKVK